MIAPLLKQQLFAGIEEQYMGKRKTIAGNEVSSFYITNVTLFNRGVLKNMEISASILSCAPVITIMSANGIGISAPPAAHHMWRRTRSRATWVRSGTAWP